MGTERTQEASVVGTLLTVGSVNTGSCSLGGREHFVIRTGVSCVEAADLRQSSSIGLPVVVVGCTL